MMPPDAAQMLPGTTLGQTTLYVGFGGQQVAVTSNAPEIIESLSTTFAEMIEAAPMCIAAQLLVERQDDLYCLSGRYEAPPQLNTLRLTTAQLANEVMIALIHAREDLLWLHAGAATYGGQAVILPGTSGRGKSTLVANLCLRGWTYLSDEMVPLNLTTHTIGAFPQRVMIRHDRGVDVPAEQIPTLPKVAAPVLQTAARSDAFPIRAIVLPSFKRDSGAQLSPCSPAAALLELLESCLNFPSGEAGDAAMQVLYQLVQRAPAFTMTFSDGERAAEQIIAAMDKLGTDTT